MRVCCLWGGGATGQARGLPLRDCLGIAVSVGGGARAGTRPAPTGLFGGLLWGGGATGQAQGLPLRDCWGVAVSGAVARKGRHKACPYRDHGGWLRGTTWVGDRWHSQHARYTAPTWHGVWGALRGESPRTREGRRPDRPELQWISGSVVRNDGACSVRGGEVALA